ncbi:unnamed protein product [Closterium sp. Yama58-4]|nr:unnamed protein product [Closterium sp. Yama58-4]
MSREARSIYERIRARPCRVARVIIAGNKRTKAAIISRIMAGALAELAEAESAEAEAAGGSFEDLQSALLRANRALRGLGVFEDVTIVVDALPGNPPGTATVVINVKEDSVLAANVGTYLQRDGRTSEARITLRNLLGYAESLDRDLGHSLLSAVRYVYSIDKRDSQVRPRTGYAMRATTELAGLGTDPKLVSFLRQELELATALPLPIANAAFTSSFRIGALLPWSLSSLSSLPGLSRSSQPPPSSATSAASSAPSSSPSLPHSLINDRFFLGGPSSLRGFQDHAVGPTAPRPAPSRARDFLGGDLSLSATTALSFDLPFLKPLQQAGVHGHVFASAGALLPLQSVSGAAGRAWGGGSVGGEGGGTAGGSVGGGVGNLAGRVVEVTRSVGREVLAAMRCTAGVGLVWPTLIGRLEANYCFILRKHPHDVAVKHGLQVGFNAAL